jgi:outer membrane protein OmpA-like peptidoglycan-associated protein
LQDIISNPQHGETAATTSLTQDASPARSGASVATAAGSSTPQIRIGQIALQGGNINFSDNFIKPNYSANLTGMNGSISELASDQETPAEVLLKGKLDNDAPVEITGKLNPLGPQLYLDLAASAHGIELARLTPYAAKYAGYSITKGKLSADVKYHVENGQLQAQNSLRLDQLTFGDKVDSPTATKLPVLLAVALLRNSRGEINLNLPVSGSLSDPEFSVGAVIARAFVNLLTKAITAPFSLLASAFSGSSDGELSYVEFAPGSSNLSADATKKLDTLAKALNDRPALTLDITGRIEPESDRDGVRHAYLDRRLRLQKIEDLRNQGSAIQMRDVKIEPSEYAKYLERAYKAEKFDKPRNLIGFAKSLPAAEMEQLMLANAPVGETELKALADQRAMAVKRYLEQQGKVGNDRMFLVTPKLNADGIKDDGKPNRVEFAIRH